MSNHTHSPALSDRLFFGPREFAVVTGLSLSTVRRRVALGDLAHVRLGCRILIPADALEPYRRPALGEAEAA